MVSWVAVGFGALDVRGHEFGADVYEYVVIPVRPSSPLMLHGPGADLWRRLLDGPLEESKLSPDERLIVEDMRSMGIASADDKHVSRITSASKPWLVSPLHELVYAILQNVAQRQRVRLVFIKGPTLHAQGLRSRAHSGDVDCWVEPGSERRFANALQEWGWHAALSAFTGTRVLHSLTLRANEWGCAIDVHSWFPGMSAAPQQAFDIVYRTSEMRSFASVQTLTPSVDFHAVIGALNEVRPVRGRTAAQSNVEFAASALRVPGKSTITAARSVGAEFALAEALATAFPHDDLDFTDASVPADWPWRLEQSTLRAYFAALKIVPSRDRFRVICRIIWPSKQSLRTGPFSENGTVSGIRTLRMRRVLYGVRELVRGLAPNAARE